MGHLMDARCTLEIICAEQNSTREILDRREQERSKGRSGTMPTWATCVVLCLPKLTAWRYGSMTEPNIAVGSI